MAESTKKTEIDAARAAASPKGQIENSRPKRRPDVRLSHLEVPERPGFRRVWKNDDGYTVQAYINAGYSVVKEKIDEGNYMTQDASQDSSICRRPVNKMPGCSVTHAVLLEIPMEDYLEMERAADKEKREAIEHHFNAELTSKGFYKSDDNTY